MTVLHLIIRGRIPSKKNSRVSAGRFTVPNVKYREWEKEAGLQLLRYKDLNLENIEIQFDFYMPDNRKCDLDNKVTSVLDMLQSLKIIKDDSWQNVPHFQASVREVDKRNPRVEIWIKQQTTP